MTVYESAKQFRKKYPLTVAWRLRKHCKVAQKHLNPEEEVLYTFQAQRSSSSLDIISTYVIVLTNKRIILAHKKLLFGYLFAAITPDMFNDLEVKMGIIWGKVVIDTVKEVVTLSNLDRRSLDDIETNISEYMMREKQKYKDKEEEK